MTPARRHLIYYYLLHDCLSLKEHHAREIEKAWGITAEDAESSLIRPVPSRTARITIVSALAENFDYDLNGVPGFFYDYTKELSSAWRINLRFESGLLRPYFDDRNRIIGLYIYRSINDRWPGLLSSFGLALGTQANQPLPQDDRSLAA
jgi:hypothetical protein